MSVAMVECRKYPREKFLLTLLLRHNYDVLKVWHNDGVLVSTRRSRFQHVHMTNYYCTGIDVISKEELALKILFIISIFLLSVMKYISGIHFCRSVSNISHLCTKLVCSKVRKFTKPYKETVCWLIFCYQILYSVP